MTSHPDQIWSRGAFSRIAWCPLEIPRLVAPPVGDHLARIVAPLRARVARIPVPRPPVEVLATPIPAVLSVANLVKAPNGQSTIPSPTADQRRAPRATATPEIQRPTANDRHAATTEKSATAPNVALDQAAPVAMIDRRDDRRRVTAERRAARTPRARHARAVTVRTLRRELPGRAVVPPIAPAHRDQTIVTTRTLAIADPVCRRATARRVGLVPNVDPAS